MGRRWRTWVATKVQDFHVKKGLQMLEFCSDFLDMYFSRQDFDSCYMDTDLFY